MGITTKLSMRLIVLSGVTQNLNHQNSFATIHSQLDCSNIKILV
ncbi:hypothetical protein H1P_150010 [Hyella patelloides LEGE 07179]|uniref:Uncharacterized protein n=1 Tax=Hyella patelloides LEGE 07179 TaxID=945734 RepID=A0A563VLW9_9CYAN|nr:hypothetical protein H1P_150010 [Hyella patelloides LEGE 07179]